MERGLKKDAILLLWKHRSHCVTGVTPLAVMCASVDLHFGVAGVENCQTAQLESDDRSKIGGSHTVKILVSQLLTTQLWVSTGYLPGRSLPGRSVRRPGSSLHPFPASASNTLYSGRGGGIRWRLLPGQRDARWGASTGSYFPWALEAGNQRSRCGERWLPPGPLSWVEKQPPPPCVCPHSSLCVSLCYSLRTRTSPKGSSCVCEWLSRV